MLGKKWIYHVKGHEKLCQKTVSEVVYLFVGGHIRNRRDVNGLCRLLANFKTSWGYKNINTNGSLPWIASGQAEGHEAGSDVVQKPHVQVMPTYGKTIVPNKIFSNENQFLFNVRFVTLGLELRVVGSSEHFGVGLLRNQHFERGFLKVIGRWGGSPGCHRLRGNPQLVNLEWPWLIQPKFACLFKFGCWQNSLPFILSIEKQCHNFLWRRSPFGLDLAKGQRIWRRHSEEAARALH